MGQSKRIISNNFLEKSREGQLQKEFNYLTKDNVNIWIICGQTAMFYFQRMSDIHVSNAPSEMLSWIGSGSFHCRTLNLINAIVKIN